MRQRATPLFLIELQAYSLPEVAVCLVVANAICSHALQGWCNLGEAHRLNGKWKEALQAAPTPPSAVLDLPQVSL
jgi:hypothetical protein